MLTNDSIRDKVAKENNTQDLSCRMLRNVLDECLQNNVLCIKNANEYRIKCITSHIEKYKQKKVQH